MLQGMCLNWQIAWTAGMQVPVEHEYGIGSRPSIHQKFGFQKINTRLHITSNRTTKTKKNSVPPALETFYKCLLEWTLEHEKAGWASVVTTGPIMLSIFSFRRSCIHRPKNCPSTTIIAFSCVENRALGWCGQLAFRLVNENCVARLQACVLWGVMSPCMCEHKQE